MKKFYKLFVLLFLLSLCCIINKSYADVVLSRWDEGIRFIKITLPYPPYTQNYMVNWAGTMLGTVDGDTSAFYFSQIQPKNGMLINYPYRDSGSVNGKMYYILKNYYPVKPYPYSGALNYPSKEAAAIQFALWHYSDNLNANTIDSTEIRIRTLQIIADADAYWNTCSYVKNIEIKQLSSSGNPNHVDTLQVIVRNNDGSGRPNVTVNLSTTNGTLNTSVVVTGPNGVSPKFFLTKGRDSVTLVSVCANNIQISPGTIYVHSTEPWNYENVTLSENCAYGNKCDKLSINWSCSGGWGGGVESNYNMAEILFQRLMKIRSGQTTKLLSNNNQVFSLQWQLQDFIPNNGPFNSSEIETTPFDILGISNATSAYACDYITDNTRVGVVFSTTTNPPEIYSHQKQTCDRLVYGKLDDLQLITVDNHQFYYGKILRPQLGYVDNAISFSVYQTSSGFIIDNKWTLDEYLVNNSVINVYNFQVWAPMLNSTKSIVEGIIAKFRTKGTVTYLPEQLKNPDVFVSDAKYINNGTLDINFRNNAAMNQSVYMKIIYVKQQGGTEQTINQTVPVDAVGNKFIYPIGLISSARIYFTSQSGFKDEIFVGSGIYSYLNGTLSTISNHSTIQSSTVPNYPYGSFVFPGGMNVQGQLNDEITITRSFDPAMDGVSINNFDRLRFDAVGTGKLKVFLETIINGVRYYPGIEVDMSAENTYEIPLRTFKINGNPVDLSKVTYAGFSLLKSSNPNLANVNFSVKNVSFYNNNEVANTTAPGSYKLYQNYPNPFNPTTYIKFDVPKAGRIQIKIYDLLGREIATILDADIQPTSGYEVSFDASKLASGVYFYRLVSKDSELTQRMVVLK